jgi:hypothetical protein
MAQQAALRIRPLTDLPPAAEAADDGSANDGGVMHAGVRIAASDQVAYKPAPIPACDVVCGNPVARNCVVFRSADRLQFTLMWHCTAGSFRWFYDEDETILLLDGGMTLCFDDGTTRVCTAGQMVFFPAGTSCVWVIDHEVRKLAFFREPAPLMFALPIRLARKLIELSGVRARRSQRRAATGADAALGIIALASIARGEAAARP